MDIQTAESLLFNALQPDENIRSEAEKTKNCQVLKHVFSSSKKTQKPLPGKKKNVSLEINWEDQVTLRQNKKIKERDF